MFISRVAFIDTVLLAMRVILMTVNNMLFSVVRQSSREDGKMEGETFAVAENSKLCIASDIVYIQ